MTSANVFLNNATVNEKGRKKEKKYSQISKVTKYSSTVVVAAGIKWTHKTFGDEICLWKYKKRKKNTISVLS